MKLLILDHLKRWWWMWLTGGVAQFLIFASSAGSKYPFQTIFTTFTLQIIYFAGVFPLSYDLQRGHSRVLKTLPVSVRQIARAWWLVSVGLPALLLTTAAGLAMLAMLVDSIGITKGFHTETYLAGCLTNTLWLGAAFFLLTAWSGRQPDSPAEYARFILFCGLLLISFIGVLRFGSLSLNTTKGIVFILIAAAMTIAGWFRAEHLVMKLVGVRAALQHPRKGRPRYKVQAGFGGLPFLVARIFTRCLFLGLFMIVTMLVVFSAIHHSHEQTSFMNSVHAGISSMGNNFQIWWILLFQLFPTIMHIRFLRTLPLSASSLAATLVLVPTTAIICLGSLIAALAGTGSASISIMSVYLMAASVGAVSVSVLVWRGVDREGMWLFVFILFCGAFLPMVFHADKAPPLATISIATLLIVSAFEITRRAIIRSTHAYRVRPNLMNAWGWGAGRQS